MYNGKENPNIDKISTCVLKSISVDYAKEGFNAFEVPGENDPKIGRTGMPTAIALSLSFKETQILTKNSYSKNMDNNWLNNLDTAMHQQQTCPDQNKVYSVKAPASIQKSLPADSTTNFRLVFQTLNKVRE